MNETLKVLENRRSCRNFLDKTPSKEDIQAIVRAGTFAPSGMGKQPVKIIVVLNRETRAKIAAANAAVMGQGKDFDPFYGAPVIIIAVADKSSGTYLYDGALAIGNMLNAAESLGLAGTWIHRAKEEFESDVGKEILRSLGIQGQIEGIGHIALGYPAEGGQKPAAPRAESVYWIE